MTKAPWTESELAILRANRGLNATEISKLLPGRTQASIALKRGRDPELGYRKDESAEPEPTEYHDSIEGDNRNLTVTGLREEVRGLEDLIRVCKIDRQEWTITGYKQKAYQGYIKNAQDQIETVQLYSVQASMKLNRQVLTLRDELDALIAGARLKMPPVPALDRGIEFGPALLAVVNPTDLHMGKYAWGKESGHNYTVEIAEQLLAGAIEDLLAKLAPYRIGKFVLTVGSDLLNADNSENTTTAGTAQATDGRQQRTIRRTWQLMTWAVERLLQVAPVHIVIVNGNHDRDMSFVIGEILSVAFCNHADVTIDNEPPRRKYIEFGKCLIGFEHGDETKPARLPGLMAEEAAEAWGRTKWRAFETGHLHDQAVMEFPGCIVRRNPALTAAEDWHSAKGFVGKIRTVHAQLWDPEDGNIAQFASTPVDPARSKVVNLKAA